MSADAIRLQLYNYIRSADDRKLQAIYTVLETEIEASSADWTQDAGLVAELDRRTNEYKSGKVQGIPWEEVKATILSKEK